MESYNNILLALDFSPAARPVAERAQAIASHATANLTLIHVYEYFPPIDVADTPLGSSGWSIDEQELMELHRKQLDTLAEKLGLQDRKRELLAGNPKTEIVRYAEERDVDLIVLGSHGRHGIGILLGSTANGVLHHANCDVLAVRIHE